MVCGTGQGRLTGGREVLRVRARDDVSTKLLIEVCKQSSMRNRLHWSWNAGVVLRRNPTRQNVGWERPRENNRRGLP